MSIEKLFTEDKWVLKTLGTPELVGIRETKVFTPSHLRILTYVALKNFDINFLGQENSSVALEELKEILALKDSSLSTELSALRRLNDAERNNRMGEFIVAPKGGPFRGKNIITDVDILKEELLRANPEIENIKGLYNAPFLLDQNAQYSAQGKDWINKIRDIVNDKVWEVLSQNLVKIEKHEVFDWMHKAISNYPPEDYDLRGKIRSFLEDKGKSVKIPTTPDEDTDDSDEDTKSSIDEVQPELTFPKPPAPRSCVGRTEDLRNLTQLLEVPELRIIEVCNKTPGMGKSTLVKQVVHNVFSQPERFPSFEASIAIRWNNKNPEGKLRTEILRFIPKAQRYVLERNIEASKAPNEFAWSFENFFNKQNWLILIDDITAEQARSTSIADFLEMCFNMPLGGSKVILATEVRLGKSLDSHLLKNDDYQEAFGERYYTYDLHALQDDNPIQDSEYPKYYKSVSSIISRDKPITIQEEGKKITSESVSEKQLLEIVWATGGIPQIASQINSDLHTKIGCTFAKVHTERMQYRQEPAKKGLTDLDHDLKTLVKAIALCQTSQEPTKALLSHILTNEGWSADQTNQILHNLYFYPFFSEEKSGRSDPIYRLHNVYREYAYNLLGEKNLRKWHASAANFYIQKLRPVYEAQLASKERWPDVIPLGIKDTVLSIVDHQIYSRDYDSACRMLNDVFATGRARNRYHNRLTSRRQKLKDSLQNPILSFVNLYYLGEAFYVQGYLENAEDCFQNALVHTEEKPNPIEERSIGHVYRSLVRVYHNLGRMEEALEHLGPAKKYLRERIDKAEVYRAEGDCFRNLGETIKAEGSYGKALKLTSRIISSSVNAEEKNKAKREKARTLRGIGEVLRYQGRMKRANQSHQGAVQLFRIDEGIDDDRGLAQALTGLGHTYYNLEDTKQAQNCYEESLEMRRGVGDNRGEGYTLNGMANVARKEGDFARSLKLNRQTLKISGTVKDKRLEGYAFHGLARTYRRQLRYKKAVEWEEQALEIFRGIKEIRGQAYSELGLANAHRNLRDFDKCIDFYNSALDKLGPPEEGGIGDYRGLVNTYNKRGLLFYITGDIPKSDHEYKDALKYCEYCDNRRGRAYALLGLGKTKFCFGEFGEANRYYALALGLFQGIGDPRGIGFASFGLGNVSQAQREPEEAISHHSLAFDTFNRIENKKGKALALHGLGNAYYQLGDCRRAKRHQDLALNRFDEIDDLRGSAYCKITLGHISRVQNNFMVARNEYEDAKSLLRKAGQLYDKWIDRRGKAYVLLGLASCSTNDNVFDSSNDYIKPAIELFGEVNDKRGLEKAKNLYKAFQA